MQEFTHTGRHPQDLASGQMLAPFETVELDADALLEPHNRRLVDAGLLVPRGTDSAFDVAGSKIDDVVAWVGNDQDRVALALEAERARGDKARTSLVDKLKTLQEPAEPEDITDENEEEGAQ